MPAVARPPTRAAETARIALQDHLGAIKLPGLLKSRKPILSNDVPSLPSRQSRGGMRTLRGRGHVLRVLPEQQ